ncbi:response regulator transcription factor [Terrilactibacillus sp. S3-3]|nr:response regulator transcription factor [Terrilactibacillus sp. S3-3]
MKNINDLILTIFLMKSLPEMNGLEISKKILELNPQAKVIIYTGFDSELTMVFDQLIEEGVSGIVSKCASVDTLIRAVHAVIGGYSVVPNTIVREAIHNHRSKKEIESLFSKRELEIIKALIDGNTNKKIADKLYISQRSIEYHLRSIYKKLGIHSREQVADRVKEMGIVLPASFEQK